MDGKKEREMVKQKFCGILETRVCICKEREIEAEIKSMSKPQSTIPQYNHYFCMSSKSQRKIITPTTTKKQNTLTHHHDFE